MGKKSVKPDLFPSKNSVVITMMNPNSPQGGSSILMRNFLLNFSSDSYELITTPSKGELRDELLPTREYITNFYGLRKPLKWLLKKSILKKDINTVQQYINKKKPEYILLVYPHLYNVELFLALDLPRCTKVVLYFHDTFVEGQSGKVANSKLVKYHNSLLEVSEVIFVMNTGMEKLYATKYNCKAPSLEHVFPEYDQRILNPEISVEKKKSFFWGGNILGYNSTALSRMITLAKDFDYDVEIASRQRSETIQQLIGKIELKHTYYSDRDLYTEAVSRNQFLLLSLSWPDETEYHEDEIATIFSTKAIEYMMAGVPIILHAPKHYFMSVFFSKNRCGYVINSREKTEIERQFHEIQNNDHSELIMNAFKVAQLFSPESVVRKWLENVQSLHSDG